MTLAAAAAPLKRTPLHALHLALGAKMVPFAGYEMPVQYPLRHPHRAPPYARAGRALRCLAYGADAARRRRPGCSALEALVPGDLLALAPLRMRYTLLLNEAGGILDDLMATRIEDGLFLVVNAARKEADLAHLRARLGQRDDGRAAGGSSAAGAAGTRCRRGAGALRRRHRAAAVS